MTEDRYTSRIASAVGELGTELALRREVVLQTRDGEKSIVRDVVWLERVTRRVGARARQIHLRVLVLVLPRDESHFLVLRGRVDRHGHLTGRGDRLIDEHSARRYRGSIERCYEGAACPYAVGLPVLVLVAKVERAIRVLDDIPGIDRGEGHRAGKGRRDRVGVLAVARNGTRDLVVLGDAVRRGDPERDRRGAARRVLVVT